jgi:hypothetical protein
MAYFAQLDKAGVVLRVIVANRAFIESGVVGRAASWVEFIAGRKNYPGPGYTYDRLRDAFVPPKQLDDQVFNEKTCQWEPLVKVAP